MRSQYSPLYDMIMSYRRDVREAFVIHERSSNEAVLSRFSFQSPCSSVIESFSEFHGRVQRIDRLLELARSFRDVLSRLP